MSKNFNNTDKYNFFVEANNVETKISNVSQTISSKRLNDYDFNILKDEAYKDISDEIFKLEYKISKLEYDIDIINKQIETAKEIFDFNTINQLMNKKNILVEDLSRMIEVYNEKGLSSKLTNDISGVISKKKNRSIFDFRMILNNFINYILSKIPTKVSNFLELKQSLEKLKKINENVDELMTLVTPYGEANLKYEQLSKYIVKANYIQSEISKHLR